jgi:hypothetical protein
MRTLDEGSPDKNRVIIESKKQFYSKEDADEMIEEEQQRRVSESQERKARAKRMVQEKTHQVMTREIQEKLICL